MFKVDWPFLKLFIAIAAERENYENSTEFGVTGGIGQNILDFSCKPIFFSLCPNEGPTKSFVLLFLLNYLQGYGPLICEVCPGINCCPESNSGNSSNSGIECCSI